MLGTVEGLRRFVSIRQGPYHGLNFGLGTVSEMLQDPAREVYDVVRGVLKEVSYAYMVMPDHMPTHPDDPGGHQAFAFAYGYIKAMIQAATAA